MLRIGFDIDGVLADFCTAYEKLFVEIAGVNKFASWTAQEGPVSWNWPLEYGYTAEQTKEVWQRIRESDHFWEGLSALPEFAWLHNRVADLAMKREVYFVTARPGVGVKRQTEDWLYRWLSFTPTVLISDQKGAICNALGLDYYIDDKLENIESVSVLSPGTKAYLLDRAYNRERAAGIRIASLEEFLHLLG